MEKINYVPMNFICTNNNIIFPEDFQLWGIVSYSKSSYIWIHVVLYLYILYVVSVWEISTGRCVRTIPVGGVVRSVSWCPNQALSLIAVAADRKVLLVNPGVGDHLVCSKTDSLLDEAPEQDVVGEV
jgi:hypothetical protein